MIAVVEGLSAAGKTSWCNRYVPESTVWEAPIPSYAPSRASDAENATKYWALKNSERWHSALSMESVGGFAICDTDPFKLHYAFSLWKIGELSLQNWKLEVDIHRGYFASDQLGLADRYFVSVPDAQTLQAQKDGDSTRSRGSFELHSQLGHALKTWYQAIDSLEPGIVTWNFPESIDDGDLLRTKRRQIRSGIKKFDQLIDSLSETPEST